MNKKPTPLELYYWNLENTLKWIKHLAVLHYYGGAFDPEHMRSIANLAGDALWDRGRNALPPYEEATEEARIKAAQEADELWEALGDDSSTDEPDSISSD